VENPLHYGTLQDLIFLQEHHSYNNRRIIDALYLISQKMSVDRNIFPHNELLQCDAAIVPLSCHGLVQNRMARALSSLDSAELPSRVSATLPGFDVYLGLKFYHQDPLPPLQIAHYHGSGLKTRFVDDEFAVNTSSSHLRSVAPKIMESENRKDFTESTEPKRIKRI